MKADVVRMLACPKCRESLSVSQHDKEKGFSAATNSSLVCSRCQKTYPIINGIPRFVPVENYASSFGFQWNLYATTQLDSKSGINLSHDRFFQVTEWPVDMKGARILEAGCGMGRFTAVAARTGAEVFTFDYSNAVDANKKNNGSMGNINFFQANIYNIPFKEGLFDYVFCLGVLQHTPDVRKSFFSLLPYLKKGGSIAVDVYDFSFRTLVNLKYWFRPITRRMEHQKLLAFIKKAVPLLFPIKMWITENIPVIGKHLAFLIPIAYHKGFIPGFDKLSYNELVEWSILDTFDKYAPAYDRPQRLSTVKKWFREAGLKDVFIDYGPNGIIARGRKS